MYFDGDQRPPRTLVLAGGDSAEREVSLASGACVEAALAAAGHHVGRFDPAEGELGDVDWSAWDACFIALHGGAGEDGRIQRRLEQLGAPYTGSRPAACELAMSKIATKRRLLDAGISTPAFIAVDAWNVDDSLADRAARLGFPLAIKPDRQGSSLGVGFATNRGELVECARQAAEFDEKIVIETKIVGRELTVAVLDRQPLPLLEIVAAEGFYDYQAKYCRQDTEYRFNVGLPGSLVDRIARMAVATAAALGADGLTRVDMMLDGQNRPWVLELNAIPGMTDRSLAPRAAARAGIEMPQLCDRLVRSALLVGAT